MKTKTVRFSKSRLVDNLRDRADALKVRSGFEEGKGRAQLWNRGDTEDVKARIERAVEYGRWRALQEVADDVNTGYLGCD